MRALVKYKVGEGNIELREVPEPQPGPEEVKIFVEAASICGSDLHIMHGDIQIPMRPPFTIGHEFSGVVTAVGTNVTDWKEGDRVTAENSHTVCERCIYCRTGNYNLCKGRLATGYAFDGAFANYCVVPAKRVHGLPDTVDFFTGALSDPTACAYHAVQEITGIDAGDIVLITGPGSMGLFSLQYVKANGGLVIITGTNQDTQRLELAGKLGADVTVNVQQEDLNEVLQKTMGSGTVDVFLECSGKQPALQSGLELTRRQGKYTQIGIFGSPVTVDMDLLLYKEIKATGSFSQKYTAWAEAIKLAGLGKIKAKPLITDVLELDEWQEGFRRFETREAIKVVFQPNIEKKR